MTLNEFKAWLEGYEASFTGGKPDAVQWKLIKAKIDKVAASEQRPFSPLTPPRGMFPAPQWQPSAPNPIYPDPNQTIVVS